MADEFVLQALGNAYGFRQTILYVAVGFALVGFAMIYVKSKVSNIQLTYKDIELRLTNAAQGTVVLVFAMGLAATTIIWPPTAEISIVREPAGSDFSKALSDFEGKTLRSLASTTEPQKRRISVPGPAIDELNFIDATVDGAGSSVNLNSPRKPDASLPEVDNIGTSQRRNLSVVVPSTTVRASKKSESSKNFGDPRTVDGVSDETLREYFQNSGNTVLNIYFKGLPILF